MSLDVYWCYESPDWDFGLFVIAATRGRAKVLFSVEADCDYTEVGCRIIRHGVLSEIEKIIFPDDPDIEKYGVTYGEEQ